MISAKSAEMERGLRRRIRKSLTEWCRVILSESDQSPAAHHLAILDALEDVAEGRTQRLLLLMPPGSAKSTYATQLFPAWWFARHPTSSMITVCHTANLAEHFGRRVKRLIELNSERLQVRLSADLRAAGNFATEAGGQYFAIGVHGAVTGRRADLALIDDPVRSFDDAESRVARERLWNWYRTELVTRLKPQGRIVLTMTRWHHDDLAGRLQQQSGWKVLRFPALAEIGDPLQREMGAALWPDWEDRAALLDKKLMIGDRAFSAMFQQNPLRDEGEVFNPTNFRIIDIVPRGTAVRAWDLAATLAVGNDPDWTAGIKLVRDEFGAYYVDDVVRLRGTPADVVAAIRCTAQADGDTVTIGLPQDPGQAGRSQVMFLTQQLAGYRVVASPETGSKSVRAMPVAAQLASGNMCIRRGNWNANFFEELASFPNGNKDDQVDALSRAFLMLIPKGVAARYTSLPFLQR